MVTWKWISGTTDWIMILLGFFMLFTGYGMTARFMERSMALLFHVGFEKWAFFAILIIYFVVSEVWVKSYKVLYGKEYDTETWMGIARELSGWGILVTVSAMIATGLMGNFGMHNQIDGAFLVLLLIHTLAGFWFYLKRLRRRP